MQKKIGRVQQIRQNQDGLDVPPGQFVTEKFPVLTYGDTPHIDPADWTFTIRGLVATEKTFSWEQFNSLPQVTLDAEFHCVTQWSRLENTWEGVPFSEVLKVAEASKEARYVMVHCYGGYSTNVALDVLLDDDVLFAFKHDGSALSPEHGGPMRLVVPKRYAWKSAKWVNGIEFMANDSPGFWETRGYHMNGDYWKEERFWDYLS
jgi:DMSO/TMAO reductase YedYZ molybdopterin-dependent catalytic subunit